MKRISSAAICLILAVLYVGAAHSVFFQGQTYTPAGASFTGFVDTYATTTEYWSCAYKSKNSYSGNCATVRRSSDNTTTTIGFLSSGKVDASSFSTFCSGTLCFLDSWVGQINGINTTDASTANFKPRMIVNANGNLSVCPQPGSKATTTYNAVVNTAKQHLFVVAKAGLQDNNAVQADVPTIPLTGNVALNNATVSSMSTQAGIAVNGQSSWVNGGGNTGITDSANFIPGPTAGSSTGNTMLSALPSGTTGTLAFIPGNLSPAPTGTQSGDNLTVTNLVKSGNWIMNGAGAFNSAYWAVGIGPAFGNDPSTFSTALNGTSNYLQSSIGEGMRGLWAVYDFDTFTGHLSYNSVDLGSDGSNANITYSTNVGLTLFSDAANGNQTSNTCFETMLLMPATQASRVAQAQLLMAQDSIAFPFAPATADGFTWTGHYQPNGSPFSSSVYGSRTYGPDVFGLTVAPETGGYTWPSLSYANNINNSTTMWRFRVRQGDSDEVETGAERSEIGAQTSVSVGHDFSFAYSFKWEQYQNQNGSWCYIAQQHYEGAGGGAPDMVAVDCKGNQMQFNLQCCAAGSTPAAQTCGSPLTLTVGVTYAVVGTGHYGGNSSDTITINAGPIGTTPIPQVCAKSGSQIWAPGDSSYLKAGIYRGDPWMNDGELILRVMNIQWNPTTANAYSAQISSPLALPTH